MDFVPLGTTMHLQQQLKEVVEKKLHRLNAMCDLEKQQVEGCVGHERSSAAVSVGVPPPTTTQEIVTKLQLEHIMRHAPVPVPCNTGDQSHFAVPASKHKKKKCQQRHSFTRDTGGDHFIVPTSKQKENKRQQDAVSGTDEDGSSSSKSKKNRILLPLPLRIEQLRVEADQLHVQGNLVQAGQVYISAINLSGPWTERSMHASLHFNYAVCQIKLERFDEAIAHAKEAVALEPTFPGAHYALGYAVGKGGKDLQMSTRSFKQVLRLRPKIRFALPNGTTFGSKKEPLLSELDFLFVYQRKVCAHLTIPPNWTSRESRSQPGKIFFENLQTRATTWILPVEKKRSFISLEDALAASNNGDSKRPGKKRAGAFLTPSTN